MAGCHCHLRWPILPDTCMRVAIRGSDSRSCCRPLLGQKGMPGIGCPQDQTGRCRRDQSPRYPPGSTGRAQCPPEARSFPMDTPCRKEEHLVHWRHHSLAHILQSKQANSAPSNRAFVRACHRGVIINWAVELPGVCLLRCGLDG